MISPDSQGGPNIALITIICSWAFLAIALLSASLLLWSWRVRRYRSPDGYLTLLALATAVALTAQTTWAILIEGQNKHEVDVPKAKFALAVRSLLVNQTLWGVANTLVRTSAILFFKQIFGRGGSGQTIAQLLLVSSILYGLVVFLEVFLICRPMAVDWNTHVSGTCGNQIVSYLVLEVLGLFSDFTIAGVSIPYLWRMRMERAIKIKIQTMFSISALVGVITALRIQALRMVNAQDFTYSKGYLGLLSTLGVSLGIIFCCVPAVHSLYRHYRPSMPRGSYSIKSGLPDRESCPGPDPQIVIV